MSTFIVSIEHDQVVVSHRTPSARVKHVILNIRQFHEHMGRMAGLAGVQPYELDVYFSSTMDHPAEYTTNPDTLALVQLISHERFN